MWVSLFLFIWPFVGTIRHLCLQTRCKHLIVSACSHLLVQLSRNPGVPGIMHNLKGPSESQPGCTLESFGGKVFKILVPNPYHRPTTWDFSGSRPEALVDFRSSPRDSDVPPELKIITLDLSKLFICDVIYETSHSSLSSTVANGHMWLANTWNVFSLKSGEL